MGHIPYLKLFKDPGNPFRRRVVTKFSGMREQRIIGYICQQHRGWVAIYDGRSHSDQFKTALEAAQHLYDYLEPTAGLDAYLQSIVDANLYGTEPLDPPPPAVRVNKIFDSLPNSFAKV